MIPSKEDYSYQPVVRIDGSPYVNTGSVPDGVEAMITGGGHGGGEMSNSGSDPIEEIKQDLRNLLKGGCVAFVILCGALAISYLTLSSQTHDVAEHIWSVEKSQASMNGKLDTMDAKISAKLDNLSDRINLQSAERPHTK